MDLVTDLPTQLAHLFAGDPPPPLEPLPDEMWERPRPLFVWRAVALPPPSLRAAYNRARWAHLAELGRLEAAISRRRPLEPGYVNGLLDGFLLAMRVYGTPKRATRVNARPIPRRS